MKLMSWNLAGRRNKVGRQVEAIRSCSPDIFAGQEVTRHSLPTIVELFKDAGLRHVIDGFSLSPNPDLLVGPRRYGLIIASRFPLRSLPPSDFPVPWPERILSCEVIVGEHSVELHTAHVPPGSSNGWIKIETFEGIHQRLRRHENRARILCGDFNSPDVEFRDGRVKFFGQNVRSDGAIVPQRHKGQPLGRWGDGERSVILDLAEYDLPDVFRHIHGYEMREASWLFSRKGKVIARRFDHIFASLKLQPLSCEYLHAFRVDGLSDHSPIIATFDASSMERDKPS